MKKLIIIFVLIPLLSIAQEVQKVEVVKSDTQIENLNKLLGQNEIKIDFLDFIQSEIDSSKIKLDKTEIEHHLKLIFAKYFSAIEV